MPPSRRNDLIDAAERVFRTEGIAGTSVDRVIQEAGVSRMTLYNHFSGKDELVTVAIRRSSQRSLEQIDESLAASELPGPERALTIFDHFAQAVMSSEFHGCLFQRVGDEVPEPDAPARQAAMSHRASVRMRLRRVLGPIPDADDLADAFMILIDGALIGAQIEGASENCPSTPSDVVLRARAIAQSLLSLSQRASLEYERSPIAD